jgi:hypothetical protein
MVLVLSLAVAPVFAVVVTPDPANPLPIQTIATPNGEIYTQGDKIIGRMEIKGNVARYYRGGKLHRDGDLPAVVIAKAVDGGSREFYYKNGERHRDGDSPAHIIKNAEGVIIEELYYKNDRQHREGDKPACIYRNDAGVIAIEEYYHNGVLSREGDAPARIKRSLDGEIIKEEYARGQSRGGLPFCIKRHPSGPIYEIKYRCDNTVVVITGKHAAGYADVPITEILREDTPALLSELGFVRINGELYHAGKPITLTAGKEWHDIAAYFGTNLLDHPAVIARIPTEPAVNGFTKLIGRHNCGHALTFVYASALTSMLTASVDIYPDGKVTVAYEVKRFNDGATFTLNQLKELDPAYFETLKRLN